MNYFNFLLEPAMAILLKKCHFYKQAFRNDDRDDGKEKGNLLDGTVHHKTPQNDRLTAVTFAWNAWAGQNPKLLQRHKMNDKGNEKDDSSSVLKMTNY